MLLYLAIVYKRGTYTSINKYISSNNSIQYNYIYRESKLYLNISSNFSRRSRDIVIQGIDTRER